jgi:Ohr subfamily peroxiredoxin
MKLVASQQKISLPANLAVTATIGIGAHPKGVGFAISADLEVNLPGMDNQVAQQLIEDAHEVCPYSNATRGNIEVTTTIVE